MNREKNEEIMTQSAKEKKVFDEIVEGYGNCGNSSKAYKCKKDCIFFYNSLFSAVQ